MREHKNATILKFTAEHGMCQLTVRRVDGTVVTEYAELALLPAMNGMVGDIWYSAYVDYAVGDDGVIFHMEPSTNAAAMPQEGDFIQ